MSSDRSSLSPSREDELTLLYRRRRQLRVLAGPPRTARGHGALEAHDLLDRRRQPGRVLDDAATVLGMGGEPSDDARQRRRHGVEAGNREHVQDLHDGVVVEAVAVDREVHELIEKIIRPGTRRTIGDDQVEAVIVVTLRGEGGRRHAPLDTVDGEGPGDGPDVDLSDLARLRAPAAPGATASGSPPTRSSWGRCVASSGPASTPGGGPSWVCVGDRSQVLSAQAFSANPVRSCPPTPGRRSHDDVRHHQPPRRHGHSHRHGDRLAAPPSLPSKPS